MNINSLMTGDCRDVLPTLPEDVADLVVTDPPFNIGLNYLGYNDRRPPDEYLGMLEGAFREVRRVLSPAGSLFVFIGPRYQPDVHLLLRRLGFHWRDTLVWHYTFGPHQERRFTPAYTPALYFTADPKRFTFNADAVRVPSARQIKYNDRRANHKGRVPDNVLQTPRVCGTHRERVAGAACQTPLGVAARIITAASNPGDLMLDPFAGSGSMLVAAKNLGRKFIGIELSEATAELARLRLEAEAPAA
jgi:site-specific DNA-methyltransferase (adenine-specific)